VLAAGVAVAASGPERAPEVVAATRPAASTTRPASRPTPGRARSAAAPSGSPRICFASMQDARAAAEGAAIPAAATVKTLSGGRVCVRPR
jgi:hypothetical protein